MPVNMPQDVEDMTAAPATAFDTPWQRMGLTARSVNPVPSMMGDEEGLYLYWLARDWYTGRGAIVDGGPLLGGSTVALAGGLAANTRVTDKAGRIHSYDLFTYSRWMRRVYRGRQEPPEGADLLPEFETNIAPWRELVQVHAGDITTYEWTDGPIEILFIDVAKTWDIQRHLLREFFPALIPGQSVVVQQDFFYVSCYWIHLVMEALSDYFRTTAMPEVATLSFELLAPIPSHLLTFDYETLSRDEAVRLMDRSLARFSDRKRLIAETAKVSLLLAYDDVQGATRVLDAIKSAPEFDTRVAIDWDKAAEQVRDADMRGHYARGRQR